MGHTGRIVGLMLVGLVGWAGSAHATQVLREPAPWVIESAEYDGAVSNRIARLQAVYTIRVVRDGWVEIPIGLSNATITSIDIKKKVGDAHIVPRGGSYALAASRKGTYKVQVSFSTLLSQDSQFEGLHVGIPQAVFSTMTLLVPRKDVELRERDELYVERQVDSARGGVKLIARLGAGTGIDLLWRTRPATPVTVEPVLYGEVHTRVILEEQLARLMSVIEYRIAQGQTNALAIRVPSSVNILHVRGSGIDDWRVTETGDRKRLDVTLSAPLKDTTYRLIVEAEQTLEEGGAAYRVPELVLERVKQERGYLAIARVGSVEITPVETEGIIRVDVKELPEPLRMHTATPAMLAFRYHQHPYRLVLGVTRHEDHPVLTAIAEQGELITVMTRQGTLLTRATYLIKANKKQFLGVSLPAEASLWSCIVGGASVKPVKGDAGTLRIPLDAAQDGTRAVTVELVYFEQRPEFTRFGKVEFQGPMLDIPTTVSNWSLYVPNQLKFLRFGGNLERGSTSFAFLEEPFHQPVPAQTFASAGVLRKVVGQKEKARRANRRRMEVSAMAGMGRMDVEMDALSNSAYDVREGVYGSETLPQAVAVMDQALKLSATQSRVQEDQQVIAAFGRLQESGVLPLKIRLPKSGHLYRFNRLMTDRDALRLEGTFVHIPMPWVPIAAFGLLLLPMGGVVVTRRLRR